MVVIIYPLRVSLDFWIDEAMMILMEEELTQQKMKEGVNEMREIVNRSILIYSVPSEDLIVYSRQAFNVDCAN